MKNTKIFVLAALVSVAGFALAKVCCSGSCEVATPAESTEVVVAEQAAEVTPAVDAQAELAKAKKIADDAALTQPAPEVAVTDKE